MESFENHLKDVTLLERLAKTYSRSGFFAKVFYYWLLLALVNMVLPGEDGIWKLVTGIAMVVVTDIVTERLLKPHYETYIKKEEKALEAWARHYMNIMKNMRETSKEFNTLKEDKEE